MRVLVVGGDGFCGWPCALHLSRAGHEVQIADCFLRRRIDIELGVQPLAPIQDLATRLSTWQDVSGRDVAFHEIDVATDYDLLKDVLAAFRPDVVVHFAEQRSAPYSMLSAAHKRLTVSNNVNATHNLLAAIVDIGLDAHLIHLGSVGIYGYSGRREMIPEGYVTFTLPGEASSREVLYPTDAGSIYHVTKAQDQLLFAFYNKNNGLRITDLNQGIVWGTQTDATLSDPGLINRIDYDGMFGTVLNRFIVQAALGEPLSVYGSGGQCRGFIHLADTVECVALVLANPPAAGTKVRIVNQVGEVWRVRDLASRVARLSGAEIRNVENLRVEDEENTFPVKLGILSDLGYKPALVDNERLSKELEVVRRYVERADRNLLPCKVSWR